MCGFVNETSPFGCFLVSGPLSGIYLNKLCCVPTYNNTCQSNNTSIAVCMYYVSCLTTKLICRARRDCMQSLRQRPFGKQHPRLMAAILSVDYLKATVPSSTLGILGIAKLLHVKILYRAVVICIELVNMS